MKSIFKSRVFWFNGLTILVLVLNQFGYTPDPAVSERASNVLTLVVPAINIILRFFTKKPVSLTGN